MATDTRPSQPAVPAERMYLLPENVLRGILEYLGTRPHREVRQGVEALERLEMVPPSGGEGRSPT